MNNTDDKIISEAYTKVFGSWNKKSFGEKLGGTAKSCLKKELLKQLDGTIVPKSLFSFKKLCSHLEGPAIKSGGKWGVRIVFSAEQDLTKEEITKFLYGEGEGKGKGKEKESVGIIWNGAFVNALSEAGFKREMDPIHKVAAQLVNGSDGGEDDDFSEESICENVNMNDLFNVYFDILNEAVEATDDSDEDDTEDESLGDDDAENKNEEMHVDPMPEELKIKLRISFSSFSLTTKAKNKDKFNPNYTTKCVGSIQLIFGENGKINLGTITYEPKRTNKMEPRKSFWEEMKAQTGAVWSKGPKPGQLTGDADITTALAKAAFNKAFGGSLFSQTIQNEDLDININDAYLSNKIKLHDKETDDSNESDAGNVTKSSQSDVQDLLNRGLDGSYYSIEIKFKGEYKTGSEYYVLSLKYKGETFCTITAIAKKEID